MILKYKVGDVVFIRNDLSEFGFKAYVNTSMYEYRGKAATISHINEFGFIFLDIDKGLWWWTEDMFERNDEV
jgi:hypothetical protein